jgi:tetrapyrrole methylase family protein/MazG family protein
MQNDEAKRPGQLFEELISVMARLRGDEGCPWDREQDHASLKRYVLEETYELMEAIDQGDSEAMQEELGDVLLQVIFHAQMACESDRFGIEHVMTGLRDKLVRRHPHVFGDIKLHDADAVLQNWERMKANEKRQKASRNVSVVGDVPRAMPALARAQRVGDKAASVGFDWQKVEPVLGKIEEELQELKDAAYRGEMECIRDELGDVLFSLVNLSRFFKVQAEEALGRSVDRFQKRFTHIEQRLRERGKAPEQASLEEMDELWEEAKRQEREEKTRHDRKTEE